MLKRFSTKARVALLACLVAVVAPLAVVGTATPAVAATTCTGVIQPGAISGFTTASTQFVLCWKKGGASSTLAFVNVFQSTVYGHVEIEKHSNHVAVSGCVAPTAHLSASGISSEYAIPSPAGSGGSCSLVVGTNYDLVLWSVAPVIHSFTYGPLTP